MYQKRQMAAIASRIIWVSYYGWNKEIKFFDETLRIELSGNREASRDSQSHHVYSRLRQLDKNFVNDFRLFDIEVLSSMYIFVHIIIFFSSRSGWGYKVSYPL